MKKLLIFIGYLLMFCSSCSTNSAMKLENSYWTNNRIDNCTSQLHLKQDGDCELYYCGLDQSFDGEYERINDTLYINEYHLITESPLNDGEKEIRFQFKYILEGDKLWMVEYKDLKSNYVKLGRDSSFVFDKKPNR